MAIFELLNVEGSEQFKKIHDDLRACIPMTKEEYIRKKLSVEYQALLKQISFYKDVWLSWANKKSVKSSPVYWNPNLQPLDIWLEFLKNHPEPNGWNFYSEEYDTSLKPYFKKKCPEQWSVDN